MITVTEVYIKLADANGQPTNERILAFCSVVFDKAFVVREVKIIKGEKGIFVFMPDRKLMDKCDNCYTKNHLRARFCNQCGKRLPEGRALKDDEGREILYTNIAHPITKEFRKALEGVILEAYHKEKKSKESGYLDVPDGR